MEKQKYNSLQIEALETCMNVLKTAFDTVIIAVASQDKASVATGGSNQRTQMLADVISVEVPAQIKKDPLGTTKVGH